MQNIIEATAPRRATVLIFDYGDWLTTDLADFLERFGFSVILKNRLQSLKYLRAYRGLTNLLPGKRHILDWTRLLEFFLVDIIGCVNIIKHKPDMIVALKDQSLLAMFLAKKLRVPVLLLFGSVPLSTEPRLKASPRAIWVAIERRQIRLADAVLCESEYLKARLERENCEILHTPGRIDQGQQFLKKNGSSRPTVLFVGDSILKGFDVALGVARASFVGEFEFIFVGGVTQLPSRADLRYFPHLPRSRFIDLLDGVDVVLLPTQTDAGPRLLFESVLRGKHVICSPYCAGPDLLPNGLVHVVNPDVNSVLNCLRTLNFSHLEAIKARGDLAERIALQQKRIAEWCASLTSH